EPMAVIEIIDGAPSQTFNLTRAVTTVGCDPGNDIVLRDPALSPNHFAIEMRGGRIWLRDLSSQAGTWLHGARVSEEPLLDGDEWGVGKLSFQIRLGRIESTSESNATNSTPMRAVRGQSVTRCADEVTRNSSTAGWTSSLLDENPALRQDMFR